MTVKKTNRKKATSKAIAKPAVNKQGEKATGTKAFANAANKNHASANDTASKALNFAFDAGEALSMAKVAVANNNAIKGVTKVKWSGWMTDNLDFSNRTATLYMRLFSNKDMILEKAFDAAEVMSLRAADSLIPKGTRTASKVKAHDRNLVTSLDLQAMMLNYLHQNGITDPKAAHKLATVAMKVLDNGLPVVVDAEIVESEIIDVEVIEEKKAA